jgi:hypothetical protein
MEIAICVRQREGDSPELAKSIIWTDRQTERHKTREIFISSYCHLFLGPPYSRTLL